MASQHIIKARQGPTTVHCTRIYSTYTINIWPLLMSHNDNIAMKSFNGDIEYYVMPWVSPSWRPPPQCPPESGRNPTLTMSVPLMMKTLRCPHEVYLPSCGQSLGQTRLFYTRSHSHRFSINYGVIHLRLQTALILTYIWTINVFNISDLNKLIYTFINHACLNVYHKFL